MAVTHTIDDPRAIIARSPMRPWQVLVVAITVLLNALDGFDILSISFASPGIAEEWGVDRAALGIVLSMEIIGMGVGSLVLGNVADRVGRKPTVLACLTIMAAGMFLASTAGSVVVMSTYRFVTGLGIGGMLACTNALASEFSSTKRKALAVGLMAAGYPAGAVVGGIIAGRILEAGSWRGIFVFGAVVTAMLIPVVWLVVPESVGFIVNRRRAGFVERANAVLTRLGHPTVDDVPENLENEPKVAVKDLFRGSVARATVLLAVAFFAHYMTFYFVLKWIPKIVTDFGFDPAAAGGVLVWANVGGLLGSVIFSLGTVKWHPRILVIIVLLATTAGVIAFGNSPRDLGTLSLIAAISGFVSNAAIVGLYGLMAIAFPSRLRAGGTGFVIGVGRGGAALGPIIAGFLFAGGLGLPVTAFVLAVGSLLAAVLIFFLHAADEDHL